MSTSSMGTSTPAKTIGLIGLGSLGSAIAANLAERKQLHTVYNRHAEKTQALVAMGVVAAGSVRELAQACTIVVSVVSDDAAVKAITEGHDGIAANLKPGGIHVSMSTILPSTSEALATLHEKHGNQYLACPVIGRPEAARARKLNFCVAGKAAAKQAVMDLLTEAGAVKCWDYGENPGSANTAKLCTNFMLIAAIESIAEGLALAEHSEVDKRTVMTMLGQTIFNCPIYVNYGNTILEEKYQPAGFSLALALKDIKLVGHQAENVHLEMPFAGMLQDKMEQFVGLGLGNHDLAALALEIEPAAGLR